MQINLVFESMNETIIIFKKHIKTILPHQFLGELFLEHPCGEEDEEWLSWEMLLLFPFPQWKDQWQSWLWLLCQPFHWNMMLDLWTSCAQQSSGQGSHGCFQDPGSSHALQHMGSPCQRPHWKLQWPFWSPKTICQRFILKSLKYSKYQRNLWYLFPKRGVSLAIFLVCFPECGEWKFKVKSPLHYKITFLHFSIFDFSWKKWGEGMFIQIRKNAK